jgi:hypothetical protein
MKKIIQLILLIFPFVINAQINVHAEDSEIVVENYDRISRLVKFDSIDTLASLIEYPLVRPNPLPNINNAKQFISYYDTLFDDTFKKKIINMSAKDIFQHEGDYAVLNGDIWINDYGEILSINYISAAEQKLSEKLSNEVKNKMYHTVKSWESNILVYKSDKFLIRLDITKDSGIRYVSWDKGKQISDKPDLILYNGVEEFHGTQGGVSYSFKKGNWMYVVDEVDMCPDDNEEECGLFLNIFSNDKMIESIRCVATK